MSILRLKPIVTVWSIGGPGGNAVSGRISREKVAVMPDKPVQSTDLDLAVLEDESATHTSADHPAEKSKRPVRLADYAKGQSATEDTVDIERKK